jgi:tetratricopeptide (TPR) repeat protein
MTDPRQRSLQAAPATAEAAAPPDTPAAVVPPAPITAAQRYSLLDEIAHGGMGVIWRATDMVLGREVAVKVLQDKYKPDSAAARRFAIEARITAQLQHPAIPPVHDCGQLPDGRPFLAMKLIKGRTLEELLRQRSDPTADRGRFLPVFEQACQGVAYAHAHQVIHRDLKPGNVMVGGFGEVQVMDWGLAKVLTETTAPATADSDPQETVAGTLIRGSDAGGSNDLQTQAGAILGTLAYMPPEQAAGEINKVDQRSDVFGLGAILTVILTGAPPYTGPDAETVRVRAIRGDLAACLSRLDGCGAEPELVALCKRCLAFAPLDRPRDAGALAEEVAGLRAAAEERARTAERERAVAEAQAAEQRRKRRWQLAAAGAVVLALLAGLGGLAAFLQVQKQANAELKAANQREHERFELALDAIKTFHTGVSEDALLKEEEFKGIRERLLRGAARFYGKLQEMLKGQPDASSQRALAQSYYLLAELTRKIGSHDEALASHRTALQLRRQLAARAEPGADLEVVRSLLGLAACLNDRRDDEAIKKTAEEARILAEGTDAPNEALVDLADCHMWLGGANYNLGDCKESLRHYEQSLAIRQRLADANPSDVVLRRNLAVAYSNVALPLEGLGRSREAWGAKQMAIEIQEKEARANPGDASAHDSLAISHNNIGGSLASKGEFEQAVSEYAKAVEIEQKAIDANPAVGEYKSRLAFFSNNLAGVLQQLGRSEDALRSYRKAAQILQPLSGAHPVTVHYRRNLAISHTGMATTLAALGRPGQALAEFDQALLLARKLDDDPSTHYQSSLAYVLGNRGLALQKLGRPGEAVAAYRELIAYLEKRAQPQPADVYNLACSYALISGIAGEKGSGLTTADADAAGEKAVATLRRAIAAGYRDAAHMRKDTDLDSLRKRPDFEKLLADLEEDLKTSKK